MKNFSHKKILFESFSHFIVNICQIFFFIPSFQLSVKRNDRLNTKYFSNDSKKIEFTSRKIHWEYLFHSRYIFFSITVDTVNTQWLLHLPWRWIIREFIIKLTCIDCTSDLHDKSELLKGNYAWIDYFLREHEIKLEIACSRRKNICLTQGNELWFEGETDILLDKWNSDIDSWEKKQRQASDDGGDEKLVRNPITIHHEKWWPFISFLFFYSLASKFNWKYEAQLQ